MSTSPDPSRRNERSHRAILAATRELLAEHGYLRLSIEAIAARAGVGKQTIYRWWPSKGAVVFDTILADQRNPDGSHELPDTGDLAGDLRTVLREVVAQLCDPATDQLQRAVTAEIQHDATLAEELLDRLLRPQLEATTARLVAAQAAGQLNAAADPRIVTELLYGPIFHRWLLRTAALDDDYVDRLLDHVLGDRGPS